MALALRPNCEYCDCDLPPDDQRARICSYECTFCADCVERHLRNVCPNCGGGFAPRPIRPRTEWRPGLSVAKRPPTDQRVHLSYSLQDIQAHSERIAADSARTTLAYERASPGPALRREPCCRQATTAGRCPETASDPNPVGREIRDRTFVRTRAPPPRLGTRRSRRQDARKHRRCARLVVIAA